MTEIENSEEMNVVNESIEELPENDVIDTGDNQPLPEPKTARLTYCAISGMRPSPDSKYAPMSLFGYVVMLVALSLPVVGFVAAVVTAFVSRKLARRRLAAASAILHAIVFAALAAAYMIATIAFKVDIVDVLSALLSALGG